MKLSLMSKLDKQCFWAEWKIETEEKRVKCTLSQLVLWRFSVFHAIGCWFVCTFLCCAALQFVWKHFSLFSYFFKLMVILEKLYTTELWSLPAKCCTIRVFHHLLLLFFFIVCFCSVNSTSFCLLLFWNQPNFTLYCITKMAAARIGLPYISSHLVSIQITSSY